jgi:hypothetical protein
MIRFTYSFADRGVRCAPAVVVFAVFALVAATAANVSAIVPVGKTVAAGGYDAGVRITNAQGELGTGTLFGKMYEADPLNPAGAPQRYLDLCFLTADHVLRPLLPGGIVNDPDNDSYPAGSIYEDSPLYGANLDPAVQPQPVLNTYLSSVGFRSIGDPTGFAISAANGVVAKKVVMGDLLSGLGNGMLDAAFAAIRVDLNNPALTAAQKAVLNALTPETLANFNPIVGPFPKIIPAAPFSVEGGYGLSGRPDAAIPGYDFVSHVAVPIDEQYGVERFLDNAFTRIVETQGFYNYQAAQWTLQPVLNGGVQVDTLGVGLSGDSGAGLLFDGGVQVGTVLPGVLTAGRMDKLAGGKVGIKYGYSEIGALLTQMAVQRFTFECTTFVIPPVPEPMTVGLCISGVVAVALRRGRRRCA